MESVDAVVPQEEMKNEREGNERREKFEYLNQGVSTSFEGGEFNITVNWQINSYEAGEVVVIFFDPMTGEKFGDVEMGGDLEGQKMFSLKNLQEMGMSVSESSSITASVYYK